MEILNKSFGTSIEIEALIMHIPCMIFGSKDKNGIISLIAVLDLDGNKLHVASEYQKEILNILREAFD